MDVPGSGLAGQTKRPLLVAKPPDSTVKKTKVVTDDHDSCVVCGESTTSKSNPLQQPSQETWDSVAHKAEEWRGLGTQFHNLYERLQVGENPKKLH